MNFLLFSGKGQNIWDTFTHAAVSPIVDSSTGDVACDSYYKYQLDVQLLKSMGVGFENEINRSLFYSRFFFYVG